MLMSRRHALALAAGSLAAASGYSRVHAAAQGGSLADLASRIDGSILAPSGEGYDAARRTFSFNPTTDHRPVAIIRCASEADITHSLAFARDAGLEIAVRSGGHDVLGASTCDGVIIDLAGLSRIDLDASGALATVGPGAKSGAVNEALAASGRAVALGDAESVAVGGLALGGGLGYMLGRHGAACDNLIAARLVTPDGRVVIVDADREPELFWGLKGGGGNFGIVTEFTFKAHEVRTVTGGQIVWAPDDMEAFLRFYRDWTATTPDELTVELSISASDRLLAVARVCHLGDEARATADLAELMAWGPPAAVGLSRRPYPQTAAGSAETRAAMQPRTPVPAEPFEELGIQWLGGSLDNLSDAAIAVIVEQARRARGGWSFGLGHYMHGAPCRVAADATPLVRVPGACTYHFDAWWGTPDIGDRQMAWVEESMAAMRPLSRPTYVNYLSTDEPDAVRRTYGPHYDRLAALKRTMDPENLLRRNRNIRPA